MKNQLDCTTCAYYYGKNETCRITECKLTGDESYRTHYKLWLYLKKEYKNFTANDLFDSITWAYVFNMSHNDFIQKYNNNESFKDMFSLTEINKKTNE